MAQPIIVGDLGKAHPTHCVGCKAETIVKIRKQTVTGWSCPQCGAFNRMERGRD